VLFLLFLVLFLFLYLFVCLFVVPAPHPRSEVHERMKKGFFSTHPSSTDDGPSNGSGTDKSGSKIKLAGATSRTDSDIESSRDRALKTMTLTENEVLESFRATEIE